MTNDKLESLLVLFEDLAANLSAESSNFSQQAKELDCRFQELEPRLDRLAAMQELDGDDIRAFNDCKKLLMGFRFHGRTMVSLLLTIKDRAVILMDDETNPRLEARLSKVVASIS